MWILFIVSYPSNTLIVTKTPHNYKLEKEAEVILPHAVWPMEPTNLWHRQQAAWVSQPSRPPPRRWWASSTRDKQSTLQTWAKACCQIRAAAESRVGGSSASNRGKKEKERLFSHNTASPLPNHNASGGSVAHMLLQVPPTQLCCAGDYNPQNC